MRTYTPKPGDVQRDWYVIDATDVVLGRLATHVATLLRGKHKATFALRQKKKKKKKNKTKNETKLATHVATLLRGKHKATFAPHVDGGDFVIVINAGKVALTGNKREQKLAYTHSGYPGGLRAVAYSDLLEKHPERAVEKAVRGMIPKTSLGRAQFGKLKVYAGSEHPHAAQQPKTFEITQVAQ